MRFDVVRERVREREGGTSFHEIFRRVSQPAEVTYSNVLCRAVERAPSCTLIYEFYGRIKCTHGKEDSLNFQKADC